MKNIFIKTYNKLKLKFINKLIDLSNQNNISFSEIVIAEYIYLNEGIGIKKLTEKLKLSPSNINYKLDILIKKNILYKKQSEKDKREYNLFISEEYKKINQKEYRYLSSLDSRLKLNLKTEDYEKSKELLIKIEDEIV